MMSPEQFTGLMADKNASAVFKALDFAFGEERAEAVIARLLESGLMVRQLPLAFRLCCHSIEWLEHGSQHDSTGLFERVLEFEQGVNKKGR